MKLKVFALMFVLLWAVVGILTLIFGVSKFDYLCCWLMLMFQMWLNFGGGSDED
jgi:hypothetical protein